jgi:NAD(P)-dependent dehydrogenase (short-subunit alcohol dehydrogenase family)
MAINARAPLFLARAFAAQVPDGEDGVVVNLLDQKLWNMNPDFLSYTASKVALEGLTTMLAMALAPRVRVVGVAPGLTLRSGRQTEEGFRRAHASVPLGRGPEPADIAGAVRYLLSARAVTGSVVLVDGGEHLGRRPRDVAFQVG